MAKQIIDMKEQLQENRFAYGLLQKKPCSKQENKEYSKTLKEGGSLPEGVFAYVYDNGDQTQEFYTVYEPDLTEAEKAEYLTYKKLNYLKTIKNCTLFFTALTILAMIAYLFLAVNGL